MQIFPNDNVLTVNTNRVTQHGVSRLIRTVHYQHSSRTTVLWELPHSSTGQRQQRGLWPFARDDREIVFALQGNVPPRRGYLADVRHTKQSFAIFATEPSLCRYVNAGWLVVAGVVVLDLLMYVRTEYARSQVYLWVSRLSNVPFDECRYHHRSCTM